MIVEMHFDQIALAHPDEFARNLAAKSPEGLADAIGQPAFVFLDFEMDDHLGRVLPRNGGRKVGRVGQDRGFLTDDFFRGVFLAARGKGRRGEKGGGQQEDGAFEYINCVVPVFFLERTRVLQNKLECGERFTLLKRKQESD
jgi:hypothetical protein